MQNLYRVSFSALVVIALLLARPVLATTPPSQVMNLDGRGYSTNVVLQWDAVVDTTGTATTTDYTIEYKPTSGSEFQTYTDGVSTDTTVAVTGLSNSTSYDFRVAAVNEFGTGTSSDTKTVTPNPIVSLSAPTPANGAVLSTSTVGIYGNILTNSAQDYKVSIVRDSDGVEVAANTNPTVSEPYGLASLTQTVHFLWYETAETRSRSLHLMEHSSAPLHVLHAVTSKE
jgi:hypothetical protein